MLPENFTTFGDLLKFLRVRARLTQRDLAIAVDYSEAQISRLELNKRTPNKDALMALFIPALQLEDSPEMATRLLELAGVVPKTHSEAPPSTTATASETRNNLPAELTSLIGRETDLAEIRRLLALPATRLLTLTGSGGCGKTRLALRSGATLTSNYSHGVWLVELAPISDPVLMTQAIINVFGLMVDPNYPPITSLMTFLKERKTLLILDNCEHLVNAVAEIIVNLLRACPELRILATSREPLGVPGEVTYRVPSLALPPSDWDGRFTAADAAQLFLERAVSVQPGFSLDASEVTALVRICRRLDGIPLAIELAAARINALPLSIIADRLEAGFAVLGTAVRGTIPRHATLHAVIDWSYHLLSRPEQVLLRRLAVFASGWSLEQVEEIGTCEGMQSDEILDLLVSLVSKSLVVAERVQSGSIRYHLHAMVRHYAREKFSEAGEVETVQRCFLEYFVRFAELVEPQLRCADQVKWLDRLDQEADNLNEALRMAIANQDALSALRLAGALAFYWIYRNRANEGRRWLDTALALPAEEGTTADGKEAIHRPEVLAARGKALLGILWHRLFAYLPAEDTLAYECEQIYMALGDLRGATHARSLLDHPDDMQARKEQLHASLPALLSEGDNWSAALVYFRLWDWERIDGNFEAGKECELQCEMYLRAAGDRFFMATVFVDRAWLEWDVGSVRKALESSVELLRTLLAVNFLPQIPWSYTLIAYFNAALGNFPAAYENHEALERFVDTTGTYLSLNRRQVYLASFYLLEGRLPEAYHELEPALGHLQDVPEETHRCDTMLYYGLVLFYQNQWDRAAAVLEETLAVAERNKHHVFLNGHQRALGRVRLAQGDLSSARDLFEHALAEIIRNRTLPDFPETLDCLAGLAAVEGKFEQAAILLGVSDELLKRMEMIRYPVHRPEYERTRAAAQDALGEDAYCAAWSAGAAVIHQSDPIEGIKAMFPSL